MKNKNGYEVYKLISGEIWGFSKSISKGVRIPDHVPESQAMQYIELKTKKNDKDK